MVTAVTTKSMLSVDDSEASLNVLREAVQRNCDIADARYAGNYTLCTYLLKMREFYRWEQKLPFAMTLDHHQVGDWVTARERSWEALEDLKPEALPWAAERFDPFADQDELNRLLDPHGHVYGAGLGRGARPLYFLGRLIRQEDYENYRVYVVGTESARDLVSPPAMSRAGQIFVRTESMQRLLFELVEAWNLRGAPADDALALALRAYDYQAEDINSLDRMVAGEIEAAIWHEIGEIAAGRELGSGWQERLMSVAGQRQEWVMRAVRDHLADTLVTLPVLLDQGSEGSLHFFFANLTGMRLHLFPQLRAAYEEWRSGAPLGVIKAWIQPGREHWQRLAALLLQQPPETWPISDAELESLRPGGS